MPRRVSPYGVGANPELEQAMAHAVALDYGETLFIPTETKADAERLRRFWFRQRKRAIAAALAEGVTLDPSAADPWRGLVSEIPNYHGPDNQWGLLIRRPKRLAAISLTRADGSKQEIKL